MPVTSQKQQQWTIPSTVGLSIGRGSVVPLVCSVIFASYGPETLDASSDRHCLPLHSIVIAHPLVEPRTIVPTSTVVLNSPVLIETGISRNVCSLVSRVCFMGSLVFVVARLRFCLTQRS